VLDVEDEVVGQLGRRGVVEERAHESFGLAPSDHATTPRRHGHRTCSPQQLQLYRCALDARDAERHAPVVDLVVTAHTHAFHNPLLPSSKGSDRSLRPRGHKYQLPVATANNTAKQVTIKSVIVLRTFFAF